MRVPAWGIIYEPVGTKDMILLYTNMIVGQRISLFAHRWAVIKSDASQPLFLVC